MHFIKKTVENKREDFDNKLKSNKILRIPGAYNPLTAKVIEEIGYDGVYVSGAVMSNDLGYPDIGLTTLDEVSYRAAQIARITNLPTICDADTGFKYSKKNSSNIWKSRNCRCTYWGSNWSKRCGHLDNKELINKEKNGSKNKRSNWSKKDEKFKIIARTDANTVEGLDKMIERAKAYEDAGADIIFPESLRDEKEFEKVRKNLKVYLLANMTEFGKIKNY